MVQVFEPILVLPLYVVQVIVQVPVVDFGIWFARVSGGVQETDVLVVFVTIVPFALPKVYDSVWVKEDDALVTVMVLAVPRFTDFAETEDALGIVFSVTVALAVICS
jgi:hypothetical protein